MYIADDSDCEQIFKLFAKQSTYKNIINIKQQQLKIENDQIVECNRNLKEQLEKIQLPEKTIFFVNYKKREFVFENGILIDRTFYKKLQPHYCHQYKSIIAKLNIVVRELDEDFIKVLEIIVEKYIQEKEKGSDPDSISQNLVDFIRKNSIEDENCYAKLGYLRNWELLKESTKHTILEMRHTKLETDRLQIDKRINGQQSNKINKKIQDLIEKQLRELEEERDSTSIEYLIQNLVQQFEQILQKNKFQEDEKQ